MDKLLCLLGHNGNKILGYTDVLVKLAQGRYTNVVRGRMQQAPNVITRWIDEAKHKLIQMNHIRIHQED